MPWEGCGGRGGGGGGELLQPGGGAASCGAGMGRGEVRCEGGEVTWGRVVRRGRCKGGETCRWCLPPPPRWSPRWRKGLFYPSDWTGLLNLIFLNVRLLDCWIVEFLDSGTVDGGLTDQDGGEEGGEGAPGVHPRHHHPHLAVWCQVWH